MTPALGLQWRFGFQGALVQSCVCVCARCSKLYVLALIFFLSLSLSLSVSLSRTLTFTFEASSTTDVAVSSTADVAEAVLNRPRPQSAPDPMRPAPGNSAAMHVNLSCSVEFLVALDLEAPVAQAAHVCVGGRPFRWDRASTHVSSWDIP